MADTLDPKHVDKRTVNRYLQNGSLDEKSLDRHLKALPDVADKGAPVDTVMDEDFGDDEEETDAAGEATRA